jgi:hypothetical protein
MHRSSGLGRALILSNKQLPTLVGRSVHTAPILARPIRIEQISLVLSDNDWARRMFFSRHTLVALDRPAYGARM